MSEIIFSKSALYISGIKSLPLNNIAKQHRRNSLNVHSIFLNVGETVNESGHLVTSNLFPAQKRDRKAINGQLNNRIEAPALAATAASFHRGGHQVYP